jgi:hypothetical protein
VQCSVKSEVQRMMTWQKDDNDIYVIINFILCSYLILSGGSAGDYETQTCLIHRDLRYIFTSAIRNESMRRNMFASISTSLCASVPFGRETTGGERKIEMNEIIKSARVS